ncbi:hypothetical protein AVEN_230096-1 [Araneus ventricosus]|uniref:Uncharacterized protein n=1 Tax=Araneus ventricosus TaxID=182803 RepID=A0A4Y2IJL8_ARAVE|nr:hypothetical protein AVEN_230096-1 [Araneus ventricosus]
MLSSPFFPSQNAQRMIPSWLATVLRGWIRKANSTTPLDDAILYLVLLMMLVPCIVFCVIAILLCEVMGTDDNDAFPGYSRKRMKKEKTWKKVEVKKKRNSGEEYTYLDTRITVVPARQIGEPCSCQCLSKIGQDNVQRIFNAFWELGNYDLQNSYLYQSW